MNARRCNDSEGLGVRTDVATMRESPLLPEARSVLVAAQTEHVLSSVTLLFRPGCYCYT